MPTSVAFAVTALLAFVIGWFAATRTARRYYHARLNANNQAWARDWRRLTFALVNVVTHFANLREVLSVQTRGIMDAAIEALNATGPSNMQPPVPPPDDPLRDRTKLEAIAPPSPKITMHILSPQEAMDMLMRRPPPPTGSPDDTSNDDEQLPPAA